uniref:Uncharacterized protein n=1 Tax=Glossina palpalis gambiensis TaxID=67801 RepID=A0A1B0BHE4_9MUSC
MNIKAKRNSYSVTSGCNKGNSSVLTYGGFETIKSNFLFANSLGKAFNIAKDMAPEPHPTSNISIGCFTLRYSSITFDTNSSVSGRGMNTVGAVFKVKSMKSHSPNMCCKGIRAQRASQRRENSECCWAMRLIVQLLSEEIYRYSQDNSSVLANGGLEIIKSYVLPLSGLETNCSVSGRGIKTAGFVFSGKPLKSHTPTICCKGLRSQRILKSSSNLFNCFSESSNSFILSYEGCKDKILE